jgi:hypothetical protein
MTDNLIEQADISNCNVIGAIDYSRGLQEAIGLLSPEKTFVAFDFPLTQTDTELLEKFQIHNDRRFAALCDINSCRNLYGTSETITDYIKYLSSENDQIADPLADLFTKLIKSVISQSQYNGQKYEVVFRGDNSNDPSVINWHRDGVEDTEQGCEYATMLNLKGPCTLFCPTAAVEMIDHKISCSITEFVDCHDGRNHVFLYSSSPYKHPQRLGALHSWPSTNEARFFIRVSANCK